MWTYLSLHASPGLNVISIYQRCNNSLQLMVGLVFAVSISCFVFCVFLMVFQITGEKRPSSEMMKPKPKPQKKKKKKDPNEPTKPVSAYALFFRDTQAAIKGQNPTATFGDVSKIVASMWDGLGEEQKQVDSFCVHVHLCT